MIALGIEFESLIASISLRYTSAALHGAALFNDRYIFSPTSNKSQFFRGSSGRETGGKQRSQIRLPRHVGILLSENGRHKSADRTVRKIPRILLFIHRAKHSNFNGGCRYYIRCIAFMIYRVAYLHFRKIQRAFVSGE